MTDNATDRQAREMLAAELSRTIRPLAYPGGEFHQVSIRAISAALTQRDEARQRLNELLCVIHRDGGQYIDEHGDDKAYAEAVSLSSERIVTSDEALAKIERLDALLREVDHRIFLLDEAFACDDHIVQLEARADLRTLSTKIAEARDVG